MCNACGFSCCAYDGFSGCGCDHCANPACWSDDAFDDEDNDEDGYYDADPGYSRPFGLCLSSGTHDGASPQNNSPTPPPETPEKDTDNG